MCIQYVPCVYSATFTLLLSVRRSLSACCWSSTVSHREWSGGASTHALNTALSGYPFIDRHCVLLIEQDNILIMFYILWHLLKRRYGMCMRKRISITTNL